MTKRGEQRLNEIGRDHARRICLTMMMGDLSTDDWERMAREAANDFRIQLRERGASESDSLDGERMLLNVIANESVKLTALAHYESGTA